MRLLSALSVVLTGAGAARDAAAADVQWDNVTAVLEEAIATRVFPL